jgi:hypothetical protein
MWQCIVKVFKHNQQDTTLHNDIYYYNWSTCFRRFLLPSSGAQICVHSIGCLSSFSCFLPLSWVSCSNTLTIAARSSKTRHIPDAVYRFELLMKGGGTAWNMYSICNNKYHCVTLYLVGCASIHEIQISKQDTTRAAIHSRFAECIAKSIKYLAKFACFTEHITGLT